MGEIVNLNRARKARDKAEDKARAAANRAAHGRTAAEKKTARTERERAERHIDGHKRED
ncbi:MAG: DUF4169 family protein [Brevundimonas sp.]|jgi:hypothetical protein|uniref:DUF4169 family protein n=1 Tax=Brevundimonas sp. TaxID=1871086 RepID=UPI0025834397|nr:DUF4169 family protein [Brevundimonas sp.]MCV0413551.1 DUF4169 family protein [Brevundimonas sp.]